MENSDLLQTLCEVSVALAGFSTVVNVFGRSQQRWSDRDRLYLSFVLETSFGALFLSLLALLLEAAGLRSRLVWVASSGVFIIFLATASLAAYRRLRAAELSDVSSPLGRFFFAGDSAAILAGIANLWFASEPVYLAMLSWLLLSCALYFVILLGFDPRASS